MFVDCGIFILFVDFVETPLLFVSWPSVFITEEPNSPLRRQNNSLRFVDASLVVRLSRLLLSFRCGEKKLILASHCRKELPFICGIANVVFFQLTASFYDGRKPKSLPHRQKGSQRFAETFIVCCFYEPTGCVCVACCVEAAVHELEKRRQGCRVPS